MSSTDPVSGLSPDAPCWCRSGRRHAECHGDTRPPSEEGAPVPNGDDDTVFLSPTTVIDKSFLVASMPGEPVYLADPNPAQRPLRVPAIAAAMAERPKRTTVALDELGRQRFAILDGLGLGNSDQVDRRVAELTDAHREDLRYGLLDIAKCTLDRLFEEASAAQPRTTIWAGSSAPLTLLGATLLWADHYLVDDRISAASGLRARRPPT